MTAEQEYGDARASVDPAAAAVPYTPSRPKRLTKTQSAVHHFGDFRGQSPSRLHVNPHNELMGPILRRRKVVSMPLGDAFFRQGAENPIQEDDPYTNEDLGQRIQQQPSYPPRYMGILRRKQVSLDLLSPNAANFFTHIEEEPEEEIITEEQAEMHKKLFKPLIFAPRKIIGGVTGVDKIDEEEMISEKDEIYTPRADDYVLKATKRDKIKAAILFLIMTIFTGICVGWKTHLDESHSVFGVVGTACVTPCNTNAEEKGFFNGHSNFKDNDVIQLKMHLDPVYEQTGTEPTAIVNIVRLDRNDDGSVTQEVVYTENFGPADEHHRETFVEKVTVDWTDPDHDHIITINSSTSDSLSFTLNAMMQTSLSNYSVLIAALVMVFVYVFILIEVIHRTLVAIFGSLVALFFFFLINNGETESIRTVMLHQEWSTLGLLFGMMLIVGELSHTGIFEYLAVRLLVSSKGSFSRLLVLLCLLTAVASAFLDNVTTMLLLAPVTIDMCNILQVDPRPYLIAEVILSNIGGTATQIGDPPNIIIGTSFSEVGFVDFIINVAPAIFVLCIPASLGLMLWIYKPYMTMKPMAELDTQKLKDTYPVYDEPRLLLAGTSTFFLILLFFLHPAHHKDTAWLALITAFVTLAFTNPHDVQDALRNHIEWDTLLVRA